jgi:hypothetical protein
MKFYVYVYVDPIINEIFYVGQGSGNRMLTHLEIVKKNKNVKYEGISGKKNRRIIVNLLL